MPVRDQIGGNLDKFADLALRREASAIHRRSDRFDGDAGHSCCLDRIAHRAADRGCRFKVQCPHFPWRDRDRRIEPRQEAFGGLLDQGAFDPACSQYRGKRHANRNVKARICEHEAKPSVRGNTFGRYGNQQSGKRPFGRRKAADRNRWILAGDRAASVGCRDIGRKVKWCFRHEAREVLRPITRRIHVACRTKLKPHRHHPTGAVRRREGERSTSGSLRALGVAEPSTQPPIERHFRHGDDRRYMRQTINRLGEILRAIVPAART